MKSNEIKNWKEWCKQCASFHIVNNKPCPSCGVHHTSQPVSDKVYERHISSRYNCEGCCTYNDHLR